MELSVRIRVGLKMGTLWWARSLTKLSRGGHQRFACWGNAETTNLCGNGYILQQERVIPVCCFAKEASCFVLKEDGDSKFSALFKKQEITIEKAMRNKRKCVAIVKGLQLFVSGDLGFLFFGAFVCSLQSCVRSRPMIAVRSSKSRGKESTESGSQLNSLQLNSEIVGTSQVDRDLGNKKKKKEVTFWRGVRQYQTKIQNCSSTSGLSDLWLQCF